MKSEIVYQLSTLHVMLKVDKLFLKAGNSSYNIKPGCTLVMLIREFPAKVEKL